MRTADSLVHTCEDEKRDGEVGRGKKLGEREREEERERKRKREDMSTRLLTRASKSGMHESMMANKERKVVKGERERERDR